MSLIIPALGNVNGCASIVPDPAAPDATVLTNDGFFPDIDLAQFRRAARLRDSVTVDRQRDAVLAAIITVGNDLTAWAMARRLAGAADLASVADVPNGKLDGDPRLVILYRRAVYAFAKADLVERYRDVDTTAPGQRRAEDLDPSIGELRRDGAWAVRDMLGVTRTCVELI
jgi:hypothetical protein